MKRLKDIGLTVVGFPLLLILVLWFWAWGIVEGVREWVSIRIHGDRSED